MNFSANDTIYEIEANELSLLPYKHVIVGIDPKIKKDNKKVVAGPRANTNWTFEEATKKLKLPKYKHLINKQVKLMLNLKDSDYFCIDVDEITINGKTDYIDELINFNSIFDCGFYTKGTTKGYHFFFKKHKDLKNKKLTKSTEVNTKYKIDFCPDHVFVSPVTVFFGGICDYDIKDFHDIFDEKPLKIGDKSKNKKTEIIKTETSVVPDRITSFLNNKLNFDFGDWIFNPDENKFFHQSLTCVCENSHTHSVTNHSCIYFNEGKYLVACCHSHPTKKIKISPQEAKELRTYCGIKNDDDILQENLLQERLDKFMEEHGDIKPYEQVAEEFEKHNMKIISKSHFIEDSNNKILLRTEAQLKVAYNHLTYVETNQKGELKEKSFINKWLTSSTQRRYNDSDVYPNKSLCPKNIYNLWTPFAAELIDEKTNLQEHNLLLEHIKVLCNNEEPVYEYVSKWIAHMIQYPERKPGICPVLISKPGGGKGTFINMLRKMLGSQKVMETTSPQREVWGDFNGLMAKSFLVNLNELGKKDQQDAQGRIKGLITDETLTVNQKGVSHFIIKSFHRFIVTTNKEDPVHVATNDRRYLVIRSSDQKVGDKDYFTKLNNLLDNEGVILSLFNYFKNLEVQQNFTNELLPKTEYHKELQILSTPVLRQFMDYYVDLLLEDEETEEFTISCKDLYGKFRFWVNQSGIKYECAFLQFCCKLKNLNLKGVTKKHTKKGNIQIINIPQYLENDES